MNDSGLLSGFAQQKVYSVSDINAMVRSTLEGAFAELTVEGEVSNFTRAASGHLYFTLKDSGSQIRSIMFRNRAQFLRFLPENGMQVTVRASLTVYEPRGDYQLNISSLEPAGAGALQIAFEQLKQKLLAEGLFDDSRKTQMPFLPRRIGIVTSPDGAAVRDILSVLKRRYPNIQVTIFPALVQGDQAARQLREGISTLDGMRVFDVLIITRGGGSMEDLWAFNDESLARAIAECRTPVISAVGHETDFTICDFVADMRAATPSAAAEMVVGRKDLLLQGLVALQQRMAKALEYRVTNIRALLNASSPERLAASVRNTFQAGSQKIDALFGRLVLAGSGTIGNRRQSLGTLSAELEALSPLRALGRGYNIATKAGTTEPVSSVDALEIGEKLELRLSDGSAQCSVTNLTREKSGG